MAVITNNKRKLMDREERERLKQEKLQIIRQKNFRKEIIKSLDSEIANDFEELDYILNPELDAIINKIEEKSVIVSGKAYECNFNPDKLNKEQLYKEVSWVNQVTELVDEHLKTFNEDNVYFSYLTPDSPIFKISKKWFKENYKDFLIKEYKEIDDIKRFFLVSETYDKGIAVSNYLGYLKEDPNPREVVYMIELWS